jgi:hypothetical protein
MMGVPSWELWRMPSRSSKFVVCSLDIVRQSTLLCGTCAFVRSNPYAGVALLVDRWTPILVLVLNGWRATGVHGGFMVKIMISS